MKRVCIDCGAPFGLNDELAAIPEAATIAFDPRADRIWLVCQRCGAWNLLGRGAADAAIPELEARFRAAGDVTDIGGLAIARLSESVGLIRCGNLDRREGDDGLLQKAWSRLERNLDRAKIRIALIVGAGVALAFWFGHLVAMVPLISFNSAATLLSDIRSTRFGGHVALRRWVINVFAVVVGLIVEYRYFDISTLWMSLAGLAIAGIAAVILGPPVVAIVDLRNGLRMPITDRDVRNVTVDWDAPTPEGFALHDLPGGASLFGQDAIRAFHRILQFVPRPASYRQMYDLLLSIGGLRGMLDALAPLRTDLGGRVPLSAIPQKYLMALAFALTVDLESKIQPSSESIPHLDLHSVLRHKAIEAAALAAVAEELDADMNKGTN